MHVKCFKVQQADEMLYLKQRNRRKQMGKKCICRTFFYFAHLWEQGGVELEASAAQPAVGLHHTSKSERTMNDLTL